MTHTHIHIPTYARIWRESKFRTTKSRFRTAKSSSAPGVSPIDLTQSEENAFVVSPLNQAATLAHSLPHFCRWTPAAVPSFSPKPSSTSSQLSVETCGSALFSLPWHPVPREVPLQRGSPPRRSKSWAWQLPPCRDSSARWALRRSTASSSAAATEVGGTEAWNGCTAPRRRPSRGNR